MDKQSFLDKIKEIGTCEDDVTRRTLLTELDEGVSGIFDDVENLTKSNSELLNDNESLRKANMSLFLRIGEEKSPEEIIKGNTGIEPEPEKRKFENLFNEKGELK